jgi:BirA family biotin operon repressor/biotin-[acetyl-CoA-carboxylase] ligase
VDSTSSFLKRNATELPDRLVVRADTQTGGRGRLGRGWSSPRGGLYTSILLRPAPEPEIAALIPLVGAYIICREFMARTGFPARVKWPNDVLVPGGKMAGILAEYGGRRERWLVVGFGVNLAGGGELETGDVAPAAFWADYADPPDPAEMQCLILEGLDRLWPDERENPLPAIRPCLERLLWMRGREVRSTMDGAPLRGVVEGLDDLGHLRLYGPQGPVSLGSGGISPEPLETPKYAREA